MSPLKCRISGCENWQISCSIFIWTALSYEQFANFIPSIEVKAVTVVSLLAVSSTNGCPRCWKDFSCSRYLFFFINCSKPVAVHFCNIHVEKSKNWLLERTMSSTKQLIQHIHQHTSPTLLTIWSTHCYNTVKDMFNFDNMVNNIAITLFTILSISTILLQYMITILLHNIVKIASIVTIL